MGLDGATFDLKGDPQYLLDSNTWVEEMPSERLCQSTRHRAACAQLSDFLQEYGTQGCQVGAASGSGAKSSWRRW